MSHHKDKDSKAPLISVVMATYNGERYIAEAIQSVLNQTFSDFEFIIVDDGSTDSTVDIIATFDDPRIIYLKKELNTGIADSLNLGILKAKGRYIARMDDDDVCMPRRFEEQLAVFERNTNIIVCGSTVLLKEGKVRAYPEHHEDIKMALLFSNPITHPTVMMCKDVLLKFPYQANMVPSEDYDLWSRLISKGEFYIIQTPLLVYRQHVMSETSRRRREQLQLNIIIAKRLFDDLGFAHHNQYETYLRIFTSKDYSVSGKTLRGLISWFEFLKRSNAELGKFPVDSFNAMADTQLKGYLISYFTNRTLLKKLIPFLMLDFNHRGFIMNYYFKKLF